MISSCRQQAQVCPGHKRPGSSEQGVTMDPGVSAVGANRLQQESQGGTHTGAAQPSCSLCTQQHPQSQQPGHANQALLPLSPLRFAPERCPCLVTWHGLGEEGSSEEAQPDPLLCCVSAAAWQYSSACCSSYTLFAACCCGNCKKASRPLCEICFSQDTDGTQAGMADCVL